MLTFSRYPEPEAEERPMEATWTENAGGMKYLPHALWILFLVSIGVFLGQSPMGWLLMAAIAFLIFPKFWENREEQGKRSFLGLRITIATLFTVYAASAAWQRMGEPSPFVGVEAKAAVAASLRDPSSAEFRNIMAGTHATCGEVNGRNAYGAYAGFKRFVYEGGIVRIEPEQPIAADVQQMTAYYNAVAEFSRASQRCYG
jgi:hypothetical protein